ncbi:hypothetical protein GGR57DRAFT_460033 [Xylariaceae sp. FL1272]|nr:hypothetical protein GGR57DRAFT_460033 [Xylariaceae sp. FL1272]
MNGYSMSRIDMTYNGQPLVHRTIATSLFYHDVLSIIGSRVVLIIATQILPHIVYKDPSVVRFVLDIVDQLLTPVNEVLVNMLSQSFAGLSLLAAATVVSATEIHGGIPFEARFSWDAAPETIPTKDSYESLAAQQAYDRLVEVYTADSSLPGDDCLSSGTATTQPQKLYELKDCIISETGDENIFFTLLQEDITEADNFWSTVLSQSTQDRTQWVPARAYVKAYYNGTLPATVFALWTASPLADAANDDANAEHYYKKSTVNLDGSETSSIFEGWGGCLSSFGTKRTNFTVPTFATPELGTSEYPIEWAIDSSFPTALQRIGPKQLVTGPAAGQTFGVLHIAVRDFVDDVGSGIEVYSAVWYPPWDLATSADDHQEFITNYVGDEAHHMVVEVVNLTLKSLSDLTLGIFNPSG